MNGLLEKFHEYKEISNYRIKYTLSNGDVIDFNLKQTDFPHLIGLHKLVDIPMIGQFNDISKENLLTLTYTDAIVNFNSLLIGSRLRGDYILFENQKSQGYNYLSIAKDAQQRRYAESFFYNPTDLYIRNQNIVKVSKVEIYDKDGNLYLEDIV